MNRLAESTSPYLLAHATNPVDWRPWGHEAFDEAVERDVPVFISIGYATCHWCHVMARESFSDPEIARVVNARFVAIKVDREEHPDVDAAYLAAAGAFTRQLGWPLTVFATPQGKTFHAATYLPPRPVQGMPSFQHVLDAVWEAWRERRDEVDAGASAVAEAIAAASTVPEPQLLPDQAAYDAVVQTLADQEDELYGGFGGAPKFPIAPVLAFLLRHGSSEAGTELGRRTLRRMGASPLRDTVDGGIFRYATQRDWSEPHYERMLYDNAQLLALAVDAHLTGPPEEQWAASFAHGIAGFLRGTLEQPDGGFASAQDSESTIDGERVEGGYFQRDAGGRAALEPPPLDRKLVTGWNGMAIGALARYAAVFDDAEAMMSARRAADHVLALHYPAETVLVRSSLDGRVSAAGATLEDFGMLAAGLLELTLAGGGARYAAVARSLIDGVARAGERMPFHAPGDPVLSSHGTALEFDVAEGATPSGLTACADAAFTLYAITGNADYLALTDAAIRLLSRAALRQPLAFGGALALGARRAAPLVQIVTVIAANQQHPELARESWRQRASVTALVPDSDATELAASGFSLFEGRSAKDGALAYRCEEFTCRLPVATAAELAQLSGSSNR